MRHLVDTSSTQCVDADDVDLGLSAGVSREQLDQLKREAVICINESLFKRLQDMEKDYTRSRTRFGFVTALLRRIKRLLRLHTGSMA
jgi:PHD/YefM family antitoxin component YafN of YafNO toxin-antitoxin module